MRKDQAHPVSPYESEFEYWTRQWRRRQQIKRALFWLVYLAGLLLVVVLVIKGLGAL